MVRLAFVLLISTMAFADVWTFFHAENVTSIACAVTTTTLASGVKDKDGKEIFLDKYEASASAKRQGMDDWNATLGWWDMNDKGADAAIDACKEWRKVAMKKVRIAHGGTK